MTFYLTLDSFLLKSCKWPAIEQKAPVADLEPVVKLSLVGDPAYDLVDGADIECDEQNLCVEDELTVEQGVGDGVQGHMTRGTHLRAHCGKQMFSDNPELRQMLTLYLGAYVNIRHLDYVPLRSIPLSPWHWLLKQLWLQSYASIDQSRVTLSGQGVLKVPVILITISQVSPSLAKTRASSDPDIQNRS